jgi:hypothetical protein
LGYVVGGGEGDDALDGLGTRRDGESWEELGWMIDDGHTAKGTTRLDLECTIWETGYFAWERSGHGASQMTEWESYWIIAWEHNIG